MTTYLDRAGHWLLHSGIQETNGGVSRYYRSAAGGNLPVSTEITGYAVSAFFYLHSVTGDPEYKNAGVRAARFLTETAWDAQASTIPFELNSDRAYFFDAGIIVRGLLTAWKATGDPQFLTRAREEALSMAFDFMGDGGFCPIISLPFKEPHPFEPRWSRSPGCYQLKPALAWRQIGILDQDEQASKLFESSLASALATHDQFLPGESDREKVMDRLHAYSYFLEALLAVADRPEVQKALKKGIERAAQLFRDIAPVFERSDVPAQILRVRLAAHHLSAVTLDEKAAEEEANRVASFQVPAREPDQRLRGGFWFGRKGDTMLPFCNPVSTSFAMQALHLWDLHRQSAWNFELDDLI